MLESNTKLLAVDDGQPYFEYEMRIGRGTPRVTLLGTPDDWRSVRRRAAVLSEWGLAWWTGALLPVLDEIVRTAEGHVDQGFWRSFFQYQSGSGPSELTGWVHTLFPYVKDFRTPAATLTPSPYLAQWEASFRKAEARTGWLGFRDVVGRPLGAIPSSLASAPVRCVDVRDGSVAPLRFVAGLFGVVEDDDGTLAPEFGWAVVHAPGE